MRRLAVLAVPVFAAGSVFLLAACGSQQLAHTSASRSPPAPASEPMIAYTGPAPRIGNAVASTNWSGYAVHGGTYHSVSAHWTEPYAHGTGNLHLASFWVGLDGWGSSTVEQTGTAVDIVNGSPVYYAWFEMYPAYEVRLNVPVSPGDHISASVKVTGGTHYTLKIADSTQGWTSTLRTTRSGLDNESAEVIAEAPKWISSRGVSYRPPLTNFGTVRFTQAKVNGAAIGHHHPTKIVMVNHHGQNRDKVSSLSGGKNWHATWVRKQ